MLILQMHLHKHLLKRAFLQDNSDGLIRDMNEIIFNHIKLISGILVSRWCSCNLTERVMFHHTFSLALRASATSYSRNLHV